MNGRELVLAAIRGEKTERVPWVPFCGVHCASLIGKTGVEMEAMTATSIALLTIYDMAKALDKGMVIEDVRLLSKSGGKSGEWKAPER